jgi:hypothetical protein
MSLIQKMKSGATRKQSKNANHNKRRKLKQRNQTQRMKREKKEQYKKQYKYNVRVHTKFEFPVRVDTKFEFHVCPTKKYITTLCENCMSNNYQQFWSNLNILGRQLTARCSLDITHIILEYCYTVAIINSDEQSKIIVEISVASYCTGHWIPKNYICECENSNVSRMYECIYDARFRDGIFNRFIRMTYDNTFKNKLKYVNTRLLKSELYDNFSINDSNDRTQYKKHYSDYINEENNIISELNWKVCNNHECNLLCRRIEYRFKDMIDYKRNNSQIHNDSNYIHSETNNDTYLYNSNYSSSQKQSSSITTYFVAKECQLLSYDHEQRPPSPTYSETEAYWHNRACWSEQHDDNDDY